MIPLNSLESSGNYLVVFRTSHKIVWIQFCIVYTNHHPYFQALDDVRNCDCAEKKKQFQFIHFQQLNILLKLLDHVFLLVVK